MDMMLSSLSRLPHRNTVYSSIQGKENALLYRNIYNIYPLVQFNPSHCK